MEFKVGDPVLVNHNYEGNRKGCLGYVESWRKDVKERTIVRVYFGKSFTRKDIHDNIPLEYLSVFKGKNY